MTNFIRIGDRFLNADHIVYIRECKSSFEMNSEIYLDVQSTNGSMVCLVSEDTPEQLIEKICGKEALDVEL